MSDEAARTLPGLLTRSVERWGNRTALIGDGERVTYAELAARVERAQRGLVGLGVGRGSHAGLLMENGTEWVVAGLAVAGLGALLVPVSTFSTASDLAFWLRHAEVEVLLASARFLDHDYLGALGEVVPELADGPPGAVRAVALPDLRRVVVRGADPARLPAACEPWSVIETAAEGTTDASVRDLVDRVEPGDDCYLLQTSGTTALPKGVLLTHAAVARNGQQIGDCQGLTAGDVVWHHFPLFFSAGCCNVLLGTLSHGAALVLQPRFEPAGAIEVIERERVTTWHLWPHVLKALLDHPDWSVRDHSAVHKGTGPFDLVIRAEPPDGLGGVNMYGMTETATAFSCTLASDPPSVRLKTQGHLLPGNEVKIVDPDTGERVAQGEQGEIRVKGPTVMRGYYKVDPAEVFDAEGFFPTGDLGFVDGDGRLQFEGRIKDVIKTAGVNLSPTALEAAIARLDGVAAAHVVGLPHQDRGEVVGAVVVPRPGASLDAATVRAHCEAVLKPYERPAAILVLPADEIPMTGTGKVQKFALRARLLTARSQAETGRSSGNSREIGLSSSSGNEQRPNPRGTY